MKNFPWATSALLITILAVSIGFGLQFQPWAENMDKFNLFVNQHSLSAVPSRVLALYSPTYFLQAAGGYFTALFIHHGWPHAVMSIFPLALFGVQVEKVFGWKGLLIAFVVGGVGGEIGSSAMLLSLSNGEGNMGSIGSSPAMYAIIAFFIVGYAPRWRKYWFELGTAALILGLEAGAIFSTLANPTVPTAVNHASHVSGLLVGLGLALCLVRTGGTKTS